MPRTLDPRRLTEPYAPNQALPMKSYAGLTIAYNLGIVALSLATRAARRPLPTRTSLEDLLLLGIATYRLSRFISKDWVTMPFRAPFTQHVGVGPAPNEAEETARGTGLQRALGELLICPYCVSPWVSAGLLGGLLFNAPATRTFASLLAIDALSDALNVTHQAVWNNLSQD